MNRLWDYVAAQFAPALVRGWEMACERITAVEARLAHVDDPKALENGKRKVVAGAKN